MAELKNYVPRARAEAVLRAAENERDTLQEGIGILQDELTAAESRAQEAEKRERAALDRVEATEQRADKRIADVEKRVNEALSFAPKFAELQSVVERTEDAVKALRAQSKEKVQQKDIALDTALLAEIKVLAKRLDTMQAQLATPLPMAEFALDLVHDGGDMIRSVKVRQTN